MEVQRRLKYLPKYLVYKQNNFLTKTMFIAITIHMKKHAKHKHNTF